MKTLEKFSKFRLTTYELIALKGGNCGCIEGAPAACTAAGYTGDLHQGCVLEQTVDCINVFPRECAIE